MSEKCIGESAPKYKKVMQKRTLFDGSKVEELVYEEDGLICLGCYKTPCEEDAKNGWVLSD
jgi:hypothetical protein